MNKTKDEYTPEMVTLPRSALESDIEWAERVRRAVDGIAAMAQCHSEACDPEWLAMEYALDDLAAICKEIVKDMEKRLDRLEKEGDKARKEGEQ